MEDIPVPERQSHLGLWDYVTITAILALSTAIGVYFGWKGRKQKTSKEFFTGNSAMTTLPTTLSLLGSGVNAIMILGTTSEIYFHDMHFWYLALSFFISIPLAAHFFLPVFYDLKVISAFEYLEKRFNTTIRKIGSICFIAQTLTTAAVVLYTPALALSQVTGLHLWLCITLLGGICTCYSAMGGLKAVMWTDALQITIMFACLIGIVILGCINLGGMKIVMQRGLEGNRIRLSEFGLDPTIRYSFWSLVIGGSFPWMSYYCVGQAFVQRYLATPSVKKARKALWWNLPAMVSFISLACLAGLVVYATFWDCDPLQSKRIEKADQLLPLFVMETFSRIPGFPGLFVAGCFSGALSTISSNINSLSAVTMADFVIPCYGGKNLSDKKDVLLSKSISICYGVLCVLLVAVAQMIESIITLAYNLGGVLGGPLLGLFSLGMFFPNSNSWGAGCGFFSSLIFISWIAFGNQVNKISSPRNFVTMSGCNISSSIMNSIIMANNSGLSSNSSVFTATENFKQFSNISISWENVSFIGNDISRNLGDDVFPLYRISYMWYGFISCFFVIFVGIIISLLPGTGDSHDVDLSLLSPLTRKIIIWLNKKNVKKEYMGINLKCPAIGIELTDPLVIKEIKEDSIKDIKEVNSDVNWEEHN